MSMLGRYLAWFGEQGSAMQIASTTALFALFFVLGVYSAGIVPGVALTALLIDHWYRGADGSLSPRD